MGPRAGSPVPGPACNSVPRPYGIPLQNTVGPQRSGSLLLSALGMCNVDCATNVWAVVLLSAGALAYGKDYSACPAAGQMGTRHVHSATAGH